MIKNKIIIIFILLGITGKSQENVLLLRDYWRGNPSLSQVRKDIAQGNSPTELNSYGFDAVTWALIENANNETIKFLLEIKGNDVNKLTHDGRTYVFWAAYRNNLEIMRYLIDHGAKIKIIDSHGYSILNFAAVTGQKNQALYDFLLRNGSEITETNRSGANPMLLVSPFLKDDKLITYFTNKGIRFNSKDNDGNGIFHYAAKKGDTIFLELLIQKGADYKTLSKNGENAFIFASQGTRNNSNNLSTFKYLENLGLNPNIVTDKGITPLHALGKKNKEINIIKYFIDKGVDVNQADIDGNTAFINASYMNDVEIINFISKYVLNINHINKKGQTALMKAVKNNSYEVLNLLLKKKSNIFLKDKNHNTLVYYLIESYNKKNPDAFNKKIKRLVAEGLNIDYPQSKGETIWHLAVKRNDLKLLKKIAEFSSSLNKYNEQGLTPIHIAAMKATDVEILKLLIELGADSNLKTDFEETVYDLAYENELLKEQYKNLNFLK